MRHKNKESTSNFHFVCTKCGSLDVHISSSPPWNGNLLDKLKALLPLPQVNRAGGRVYVICNSCGHRAMILIR